MIYLRLKKNSDFQKLFNRGKKAFSPYITLIYMPADRLCMGVAVSKKHGKAVRRNRIKRLLRAAFSECGNLFERPLSVILIPKVRDEYTFDGFVKSLKLCISKVNKCPQS